MNDRVFKPKFYDILKASQILTERINNDLTYSNYKEEFEFLIIDNLLRDTYFRLKDIPDAKELLNDITVFIKENYPNFMKNRYIRSKGLKYRVITYFIYKRKYKLLSFISRRNHD